MYETKLLNTLMSLIVGSLPFLLAAFKNRFGMGILGLLITVVCNKLGGLWLAIPVCLIFCIYFLKLPLLEREE